MTSSKPTLKQYESKWSEDNVLNFQIAYENSNSNNKEKYLSSLLKKNKPSIDKQYQAFVACFINDCGLRYKGGAGGRKKVAKNALRLTTLIVKFVNGYRSIMGRSRVEIYDSSALLRDVKGCISVKTKKAKEERLTKEMVLKKLKTTEECLNAFLSLYYEKVRLGDMYDAQIIVELQILKNIIGEYYDDMFKQDMRNKSQRNSFETYGPSQFNTEYRAIPSRM